MNESDAGAERPGPRGVPFALTAADGYRLAATLYPAEEPALARIVVAGATAVPQGFYRRFAQFAAVRGYDVLTFDYRGIGGSAPETLRGFRVDYLDWARLDLAAAIDEFNEEPAPLHVVGHSFGGQALGLLRQPERVRSMYTFATGAGWHGWMPPLERARVLMLWHVLGPALTSVFGYLPWSRFNMGEDLPLDIYRQWRRWCRNPRYFFDDPEMAQLAESFAAVTTPIVAANALDDSWAPPASRDAFMDAYRASGWRGVDLDARQVGPGRIGHMGYFRAGAEPLWSDVLEFLGEIDRAN
jgi:predicted alpha/beta hydrolase